MHKSFVHAELPPDPEDLPEGTAREQVTVLKS